MAYGNYLASVLEEQINALRTDPSGTLAPSVVQRVSHVIAYWVGVQPLGRLLGEAIDGGLVLSHALRHPLRSPVYYPPDRVVALHQDLCRAWQLATSEHPLPETDWYRIEIEKVLKVFRDAAERGPCVVSVLEPPMDQERASRVRIPLAGRPGLPPEGGPI